MNKLIILRGPSASGKTTIAKKLFSMAKYKTAIIHQDYYRFIFNLSGAGSKSNSDVIHKLIEYNTTTILQSGYNVILEGILTVKSYQPIIERLIQSHAGNSFIFYFDISFEETLKRHQHKKESNEYGEQEMKQWYNAAHRSNHELETIIPETYSENQIIDKILNVSKFEIGSIN